MKRGFALLLSLAALSVRAQMLQSVSLDPQSLRVTVGTSAIIRANAKLGCCSNFPWRVTFLTADPSIATATGLLEAPVTSADVTIIGMTPGVTQVLSPAIGDGTWPLATVEVVCPEPTPLVAESPVVGAAPGSNVILRLLTLRLPGQTFDWYLGEVGDISHPLDGIGPELRLRTGAAGSYAIWVLSTEPCGTRVATFRVDVGSPRRRATGR